MQVEIIKNLLLTRNYFVQNPRVAVPVGVGILSSFLIGPLNILSSLVSGIEWILAHLVFQLLTNLIQLVCGLLIPITGLIIAGIFSVPQGNTSFSEWLFDYTDKNGVSDFDINPVYKFIRQNYIEGMKQKFIHLGFCKLVYCSIDNKNMMFIGIYNTWFPLWSETIKK
jgi:hypothetical protein